MDALDFSSDSEEVRRLPRAQCLSLTPTLLNGGTVVVKSVTTGRTHTCLCVQDDAPQVKSASQPAAGAKIPVTQAQWPSVPSGGGSSGGGVVRSELVSTELKL